MEALISASYYLDSYTESYWKVKLCFSTSIYKESGGKITLQEQMKQGGGGHRIQYTTSVQLVQQQEVKDTGVSNFLWPNHARNAICCKLDTLKFLLLEEINIVKPLPRAPNFIIFKIYIFPILNLFKAKGLQFPSQLS